jgi:hypothetical protein
MFKLLKIKKMKIFLLIAMFSCLFKSNYGFNSTTFVNSKILTQELGISLLNLIGLPLNSTLTRIYQASTNGFGTSNFHSYVNGINGTLIVIKSTGGSIFGGFTMINWGSTYSGDNYYPNSYNDPSAYIFSLVNPMNYPSLAHNIRKPIMFSVIVKQESGPTFGGGPDLEVADQSNTNAYSYTNFANTYALDNLTLFNSWNHSAKISFLTGAYYFQTVEIEVYTSKYNFYLSIIRATTKKETFFTKTIFIYFK